MTRPTLPVVVRLFAALVAVLLVTPIVAEPVEAKGWKDRLKIGNKAKKGHPEVGISEPVEEGTSSEARGQRTVLLITKPQHDADMAPGSTIAFIPFNSIGNEMPRFLSLEGLFGLEGLAPETRDYPSPAEQFRTHVGDRVWNSVICAQQVEAAVAQHLADLNRFRVVTRDTIGSVFEELELSNSGTVDTTSGAELGRLLGADFLIFGRVQLCVSSRKDNQVLAEMAASLGGEAVGGNGFLRNLLEGFKAFKPEKLRALIFAQIHLVEAETGKRVFTTSLNGEFFDKTNAFTFDLTHEELIYRAADHLANTFIDNFLARQEPHYLPLHASGPWDFGRGIDLIQLGRCDRAERHFADIYVRHHSEMQERDIAKLMYNHAIALMCSNRADEARDRLWESLRLANDAATFEAIAFTDDTVDRGRVVLSQSDPIIRDVERRRFPGDMPTVTIEPTSDLGMGTSAGSQDR